MTEQELDALDRKILYELDRNSRQSAAELGKRVRAHRNVVSFRINRLVQRGAIKEFVTMISPSVMGLVPHKIYFQFQNFTDEKEERLIELIKSLPVYWAAKVSGRWDFIIGLLVKSPAELNEFKLKILEAVGDDIVNKSISVLVEAPYFYRNYLINKEELREARYWIKESEKPELDAKDKRILSMLARNSRVSVLELSNKVGLSVKTIVSKIRKLEKAGVIADYRINIGLDSIGYKFFKYFISLKKASKEDLKEFINYCRANKNITIVVECVGDWDLEPEFEVESSEQFNEIISDIRNRFSHMIKTIETIDIIREYSYVCIP